MITWERLRCVLYAAATAAALVPVAPQIGAAEEVTYSLIDEEVYDKPIKTQIEQHIVVSGVPSKTNLESEISTRYRAALARRGFRYHNPATNIYIYVYGSEEQARAGQGLWVGMLAKSYSDKGTPKVLVNDERFAALSAASENRFGLSEAKRQEVYREIATAEERATRDAMARVPDSQIMKQIELERELKVEYKAAVARRHGLTEDHLFKISVEGIEKGWPVP